MSSIGSYIRIVSALLENYLGRIERWELGGGTLLKEVFRVLLGVGFEFSKDICHSQPPTSLSCDYIDQDMNSQLFLHSALIDFNPLKLQIK